MTEDFTSWLESDASNRLSRTVPRSTWTGLLRSDSSTYAYKDYGIGFFVTFTHEFTLVLTAGTGRTSSQVWRCSPYVISNNLSHRPSLNTAIALTLEQDTVDTPVGKDYSVFIEEFNGGTNYRNEVTGVDFNYGIPYYVRLVRSGVNVTVYYYTDAARTVLYGSQSMVLHATPVYRYLMAPTSVSAAGTQYTNGYIEDLDLGLIYDGSPQDLKAVFEVAQWIDLKAEFRVAQDIADLKAEFRIKQLFQNLKAVFKIRRSGIPKDLFAKFETSTKLDASELYAKFGVRRIYDLSDQGGVGFFWKGVGGGHVDIQIFSSTGAWIGKFPDFGEWTWIKLLWENLQEVDIDGSRPDKSQITGFLWTYHTPGERHLDGLYGLPIGGDPDVKALMTIRHAAYNDLSAYLFRNLFREDLYAKVTVRQNSVKSPDFSGAIAIGITSPYNWGNSAYHVYGLQNPNSKKSFSAAGRHWLFYDQGELDNIENRQLCFVSSKKGAWIAKTYVPGVTGVWGSYTEWGAWATFFDGVHVHLAFTSLGSAGDLQYVRGTLQTDGTIIWGAVQTILTYSYYAWFDISVDINGYPYIIYANHNGSYFTGAYLIKSTQNDGTWITEFDTGYHLETNKTPYSQIFRLKNGNMIILRADTDNDFDEYVWNGITITNTKLTDLVNESYTATIDSEDIIHVVAYGSSTIKYRKRLPNGNWTDDVDLITGLTQTLMTPTISAGINGELVIFYYEGNEVSYIRYTPDNGWSEPDSRELPYDVYRNNLQAPLSFNGKIMVYAEVEDNAPYSGTIYALSLRTYNPLELKAEFVVRYGFENLKAEFVVRYGKADLFADFRVPFRSEKDLYARFKVEPHKNLKAVFTLRQLTADLKAEFVVGDLVDIYTISSEVTYYNPTVWTAVTGMPLTIPNVKIGDKIVVIYDGQYSTLYAYLRLTAGGTQLGPYYAKAGLSYGEYLVSLTRSYVAIANGNLIIQPEWYNGSANQTQHYKSNMVIMHFRA